jgi:hypothetical protein
VVPPSPATTRRAGGGQDGDALPEKLVKYVPAETLAFFVPVAAALGTSRDGWLVAAIVVAALGTVGYLWQNAQQLKPTQRPLGHFYVLAVVAFCAWAVGTSGSVADLLGADDIVGSVLLGFAVFLIPLADGVLNTLQGR